jgi:hypothetical protein
MKVNKYLQHILKKNSNKPTLKESLDFVLDEKEAALNTYLFLIEKRLKLKKKIMVSCNL